MTSQSIIFITLALLVALGFGFFQYLFKKKNLNSKDYIFFGLRALAVFIVLLLIINPRITSTEYEIEKPNLIILSDNSESISFQNQQDNLVKILKELVNNEEIGENFQINDFSFGETLNLSDSLDFSGSQTDINAALTETESVVRNKNSAIILLTDGNQSMGRDFRYFKSAPNASIYPVIIGDTATYKDLSIERVNANKYAFLNNRFPVEAFLNYSGGENIQATVNIKSGNTIVYSEKVQFSQDVKSKMIRTDLPATSLGVKTYSVEIDALEDEKNKLNNQQNFAIEVIDERTSVLILSDISHPDLGAIQKSIESNQQRSADIKYINDENIQISEYQLLIVYQVNRRFNNIITEILENNYNYLMISGSKTDWNYLNNLDFGYARNSVNQPQEFFPVYNETFGSFQFEDIGFDDFPPLLDKFGPLEFQKNKFSVLLFQEIQGVQTQDPLMAVSQNSPKSGFLLGENIWRWRAKSFIDHQSFEKFDDFFGKLIQNLARNSSKQRLTVESENFYYANQNVIISAQYFDENYQFDAGADLKITVVDSTKQNNFTSDLVLKNNFYQFDGGGLEPGKYSYKVIVLGKNLSKSGTFEVIEYNTEQQFISSNLSAMRSFAENNESRLYDPNTIDELVNSLLTSDKLKPVQKSQQKAVPLIDWYYLLFILIIVLAIEWFYRKYLGLI